MKSLLEEMADSLPDEIPAILPIQVSPKIKKIREPIGKKLRFEVLKRDKFTCQYCGQKAPDVILHVDHIQAVANGGSSNIINLVTACSDCNGGKSARPLSINQTVEKQRKQLENLEERREQLQLVAEWQKELIASQGQEARHFADILTLLTEGRFVLSEEGKKDAKKLIKKYGFKEVTETARESFAQYYEDTSASFEAAFKNIDKRIRWKKFKAKDPEGAEFKYALGIARKRFHYIDYEVFNGLVDRFKERSIPASRLSTLAARSGNWSTFLEKATDEFA